MNTNNNSCFKRGQNVRKQRKSLEGNTSIKCKSPANMRLYKRRVSELHESIERICEEGIDTDSVISCDCQDIDSGTDQLNSDPKIQEIWPSREISSSLQKLPGSAEIISMLISGGVTDCLAHANKESTILIASWLGRSDYLDKALNENIHLLEIRDSYGRTALHLAAAAGNAECVRQLIQHDAQVDVWDKEKLATPLHCAASANSLSCLKLLLDAGANIDAGLTATGSGKPPIYYAVQSNSISCLQELLAQGATANMSQIYSETALHLAASLGFAKCVKILLQYGADVRAQFGLTKSTPLHLAAQDGNAECAKLLLDSGADNTTKNIKEQTPLHLAALAQSAKTLELLLQHNADPNARDTDKRTPLHCAIVKGSRSCECVQLLLKHGVNVNAADAFGYTAVHLAALNECTSCLKLLLDNGADVTKKTKGQISALSFIARRTPEILRYLETKLNNGIRLHDHELGDVDCEIKLDFRFLAPDIWAGETALLLAFVEVGERQLLRHPLCEVFLHLKWLKIRKFFVLSLILHALYVLLCSIYILNNSKLSVPLTDEFFGLNIVLLIITFSILIKELFQVAHSWKKYITHWENWLQWLIIITVFLVLIPKEWLHESPATYQNHVSVFSIFFNWIELMVLMGRFPMFGLYVQMFTTGAINFGKFLLAYCCLLLAFAFAFRITFPEYQAFDDIAISIVKTIVMMTGELEFEDIFFPEERTAKHLFRINWHVPYPGTAHLFFLLFTLIVTTVLTNLLVGLSVSDIQGLQRSAGLDRLVRQVELVAYMESMLFSSLLRMTPKPFMAMLRRNATLLSSPRQWTLIIRPNDPREKRIPKALVKGVYVCVAERRQRSFKDQKHAKSGSGKCCCK